MKQFSLILILVSCILEIITRVINIVDIYIANINAFSVFLSTYSRFGSLTLIVGFLGLYISAKNNFKTKLFAIAIVLSGFIQFLMIEFGFITEYGTISALILLVKLILITLFILEYKDEEVDGLRIKGYIAISSLGVYWLAFFIISFIPVYITSSAPHASLSVLPFFYILMQAGLWIFFLELYREIFNYKNEYYINL
jgi:hypothetical protein